MTPFRGIAAIAFAIAVLPAAAHAASFDCAAARSPIEHAICTDAQLSALDSELADTYRAALSKHGVDTGELKAAQRDWLKQRAPSGQIDVEELKSAYRSRIDELEAQPAFPEPSEPVNGQVFPLTAIAKQHDFVLRMLEACPAQSDKEDTTCEGPAQLVIHDKGQRAVRQVINLPRVFVALPKGGMGPLVNSAHLYDYQGVINVGDFNFDGQEDFGIQTGNEGSYGGPSYDVYLFNARAQRFVRNSEMTSLILSTLGFFEVDAKNKRLRTFAKGGCCYHETTTYRVDHDVPVAVGRYSEEVMNSGDKMKITEETLVNGKWRSKVHYEPIPK
ncbi:lysozyme inhibitor LprI family protein [Ralstonia sp. 22086]|uniref:lysozyme inhibitor LprI family protein n=1 Tax=Ralstonia sp. 22086 TaxID=3453870 RepID=UPI003F87BE84